MNITFLCGAGGVGYCVGYFYMLLGARRDMMWLSAIKATVLYMFNFFRCL